MFVTNIEYNIEIVRRDPTRTVLTCHPETRSPAVEEIEARVSWTRDNALAFAYVLKGDLMRLRIPLPQPSRRTDRLWQHTCFEAFVALKGNPEYYEFNFAPSSQWAAYGFQRYRVGTALEDDIPTPRITSRKLANGLDLEAIVHLGRLPVIQPGVCLQLALCAVIEDENGTLSYWALKHSPGKPDFHHRDTFALDLVPSGVNAINDPLYTGKP
jgi:hypothetical protein